MSLRFGASKKDYEKLEEAPEKAAETPEKVAGETTGQDEAPKKSKTVKK